MIKVIHPGFYTTIQDKGRFNYRAFGVPVSGVMDEVSYKLLNDLLGNHDNAAALECTMVGPTILFLKATKIAITGGNMQPQLNNQPIQNNRVYLVAEGDILSFKKLKTGYRTYIGVFGGLKSEVYLESKSYYYPVTPNKTIEKDSEIEFINLNDTTVNNNIEIVTNNIAELTVFKAPEFDVLSTEQIHFLETNSFTVDKNNRMAYQFKERVPKGLSSIVTSATIPGTIQLTPSGNLIILMKDAQTTGGYARIFQLTNEAIAVLAQKKMGDKITFKVVDF